MKKLIAGLLMLAMASIALAEADPKAGESKVALCAACHGPNGNSVVPLFPKLAGQHPKYIGKQLRDMKIAQDLGGRTVPEMVAIVAALGDQDIADIAAYYGEQAISNGQAKVELVKKGESIYRAGIREKGLPACTGCHGPDGKGNNGAGFPALAGQHSDYIEKQLKAFRVGAEEPGVTGARVNDGEKRMMRDIASRLSDLEIKSVASFISGLH